MNPWEVNWTSETIPMADEPVAEVQVEEKPAPITSPSDLPWERLFKGGLRGEQPKAPVKAPAEEPLPDNRKPWEVAWSSPAGEYEEPIEASPVSTSPIEHIVDSLMEHLAVFEGVKGGDTLTDNVTEPYGVTQMARDAVKADKSVPPEQVARMYINYLDGKWENRKGYKDAPEAVKEALLDLSYNLGERALTYTGIKDALASGDYDKALLNTLDVTKVSGKGMSGSVIGIAKRRAEAYNKAASVKITEIRQDDDGRITYYDENGNVVESHKSKQGRHPESTTDVIRL